MDTPILSKFEAAVAAATWLADSDLAAVELCRKIASQLDNELDVALIQAYHRLLADLGLVQKTRPGDVDSGGEVTWLDEIRRSAEAAGRRKPKAQA